MTYDEKRSLYESIMKDVAKIVKKRINEGYWYHNFTQHIIQILPEEDATVENYKRIARVLKCFQDIFYNSHMLIHDGIMDDSCWSAELAGEVIPGAGAKYWEGLDRVNEISKLVPDLTIRFCAVEEADYGSSKDVVYKNGHYVRHEELLPTSHFYSMYGIIKDESTCCSSDGDSFTIPDPEKIPRYKNIRKW